MTESASEDRLDKYLWDRRHEVLYNVELSSLYHQKRERFFELWDKLGKVASLFGGSAALFKAADAGFVSYMALAITATSALSLVFGFSERSKRHADLSRKFKLLAASVVSKGEIDFTEQDINAWNVEKYQLETSEPPALTLLVVLCQNEIAIAQNQKQKVIPVGFWKRQLANYIDLPAPHT
ncbi:hypothetical protein [Chromobacterium violaceum]|uniref:hypothetical protein n=1 Tax=Chromobacterium violaceum TaxID=536 RepID=UPI0012D43AB6|nr:hypothetical protein [Chromobacterium violaceum]